MPLQASTADCARQGPTGQDQVSEQRKSLDHEILCSHGLVLRMAIVSVGAGILIICRAGASSDLNCTVCEAGTYGPGSGACALQDEGGMS